MRHTILRATLLALAVALGGFACGGGGEETDSDGDGIEDAEPIADPLDFCGEISEAICDHAMNCYTAEERAQYGMAATYEECLAAIDGRCQPDNVCEDGTTYNPDKAGSCVVELQGMSCDAVRDPNVAPGPACSTVCQ
jgi:hypothetical protein